MRSFFLNKRNVSTYHETYTFTFNLSFLILTFIPLQVPLIWPYLTLYKSTFLKDGSKRACTTYLDQKKKYFMWGLRSLKNFSSFPKWYAILMPVHYEVAVNCLTAGSAECLAGRAVLNLLFRNGRTFKVAAVSRTEFSAGFTHELQTSCYQTQIWAQGNWVPVCLQRDGTDIPTHAALQTLNHSIR